MQKLKLTILKNISLIATIIIAIKLISDIKIDQIKQEEKTLNDLQYFSKISKPTNLKNINQIYKQIKKIKRKAFLTFLILIIIAFVLLFSFRYYLILKTTNNSDNNTN